MAKFENQNKFLITGLGNIGSEYTGTRHNIGFEIVERFASQYGISFLDKRLGAIAQCKLKNKELVLLKPNTFMNLSGNAVRYWLQEENIPQNNLLVIVDDLALQLGDLRLKAKGSHGGHNGLRHIESVLGSATYHRLRIGIGSDFSRGNQVDYVLGHFNADEQNILLPVIEKACKVINVFALAGSVEAIQFSNTKTAQ